MPKRKSRKNLDNAPTHYLKIKRRVGGKWMRVGAVWTNKGEVLTIKLHPGVVLDWHDFTEDGGYALILVPNDY